MTLKSTSAAPPQRLARTVGAFAIDLAGKMAAGLAIAIGIAVDRALAG